MVKKISGNEFDNEIASGVSVVDFNATWCGPCKMLAPILEEVSGEMTDVKFFAVDVDENQDLARKFNIMSIPAVAVFKDGALQEMNVGMVPKDALKGFIEKNQ
ncbi:MAG: thioredoxin [Lachnospiraceae bacterium]|nr:thioredoxin [Lachnospiraceae bacterium]